MNAPSSSEIEISIFGRGYGESILIHVGDGNWVLIDSLLEQDGTPAALRYLSGLGVDPETAIRSILATHWHDDHVGGISRAYRAATTASLSLPNAMNEREVLAYLGQARTHRTERISSGIKELEQLREIQIQDSREPIRFAKANTMLLRFQPGVLSHGEAVAIEAISPCDADVEVFLTHVASAPSLLPGLRLMPFEQNDVSVAVWISIGAHRILLGADLETTSDSKRGWHAVLNSPAPLDGKAGVVKIAHHGSHNGHHQPAWDKLVGPNAMAGLTTWNRGTKLPKPSDIDRILNLTPHAYVTSRIDRKPPPRPRAVERTLDEAGVSVRGTSPRAGHVRFRLDLTTPQAGWNIELQGDAVALSEIAA